jgi:hypothetical protein
VLCFEIMVSLQIQQTANESETPFSSQQPGEVPDVAIQSKTRLNSTSNFVEQSVVSTDYDIHSHDDEEALESSGPLHELEDAVIRFFCSRQCPLDIRAFWHFVPAANAKEYCIDDHIIHGGTGTLEPLPTADRTGRRTAMTFPNFATSKRDWTKCWIYTLLLHATNKSCPADRFDSDRYAEAAAAPADLLL